ncbi:MAG: MFS transporter [Clostridia bacterium]|nr:MFS transporter [Clostridia bacterium]MBQ7046566.1 MFS transporter [Oscillospiraceae bacterium]
MKTTEKVLKGEKHELERFKKMQNRSSGSKYFLILLILIAVVNILDEVTSNLTVTVQSSFVTEFFVNNPFMGKYYTYQDGLAFHSGIGVFTYVLGLFTPFYKALADKWGRKPLFVISTLGMATGLLVIHLSSSYIMFLVGFAIISFFMGHDIQIIYILEEAPDKHRAKIYSFLKSFGILGVVLIPTLRDILMGNDATKWREIFLVPALIGFAATALVIILAKDTKVFINERIAYLSRPYEERQAEKALKKQQKQAQRNQSGVFNGVKYIFANKDTKMLIIAHIIFDSAMPAIALYFESSMHQAGMSTSEITKALFMVPVIYATITFLSGFIADKAGRKTTVTAFSVTCVAGYILFVAGILNGWNPYLVGAFAGLYQGSYWIGRDYMNVMMTEKVPTDIRASVVGAEGLLVIIGLVVGYASIIVGMTLMRIWWACLAIAIPAVAIAAILFTLKVKETKGANLDEIK